MLTSSTVLARRLVVEMYMEHLEYFILAYEQRHFAAAAKLVPMTPQGMIKAVRSLEQEFGVCLFEAQQGGTLKPTAYADELYATASDVRHQFKKLNAIFKTIKAQQNKLVTVGLATGVIDFLGPGFFAAFEQRHPDVSVSFLEAPDIMCDECLERKLYDFAFTVAPFFPNFNTVELATLQIGVWVNRENPLSASDRVRIAELERNTLCAPGKGYKFYEEIERLVKKEGVRPQGFLHSWQMSRAFESVKENQAIATILEIYLSDPLFSDESVVYLPFEDFSHTIGISMRPDLRLGAHHQCFYDYVMDCRGSFPIQ